MSRVDIVTSGYGLENSKNIEGLPNRHQFILLLLQEEIQQVLQEEEFRNITYIIQLLATKSEDSFGRMPYFEVIVQAGGVNLRSLFFTELDTEKKMPSHVQVRPDLDTFREKFRSLIRGERHAFSTSGI